jgi:hypothetical protein
MKSDCGQASLSSESVAPFLEGFYERVALQVGVDVSLVEAVALGSYESTTIEDALRHELEVISSKIKEKQDAA